MKAEGQLEGKKGTSEKGEGNKYMYKDINENIMMEPIIL